MQHDNARVPDISIYALTDVRLYLDYIAPHLASLFFESSVIEDAPCVLHDIGEILPT